MAALTLDQIDSAIARVAIHGQSYTLPDGRMVTQANLAELRKLRSEIVAEMGSSEGTAAYGFAPVAIARNPQGGNSCG